MPNMSRLLVLMAILPLGAVTFGAQAQAADGVKAGVLTCNVDSGWGLVFGSSRDLKCVYAHGPGSEENYVGRVRRFGVDIGYQAGGVIAWTVIAPTSDVGKGALAGDYGGVSGSATAGVGVGANVLTGGFRDSFALQPVSIEGLTGLNVAGGIAQITLEYQPGAGAPGTGAAQ
jgi:hypothetical protein